jgi:LuxR family quorum-sensing system transcriptional regulator CciR
MTGDVFLASLEAMLAAATADDLRTRLLDLLDRHGFANIAYCDLTDFKRNHDLGALMHVLTFPDEWTRYYASRNYAEIDPVFHMGPLCRRPFTWQDLLNREGFSRQQREMIHEARSVGMHNGLTVPMFGPGGEHTILSATHSEKIDLNAEIGLIFQIIAQQFNTRFRMLTDDGGLSAMVTLTPREKDSLLWTARGKSSWEIGHILHISARTVDHYIASALRKLCTHSRVAGVVRATALGLIAP